MEHPPGAELPAPAEAKPAEAKPAEAKPAETKPPEPEPTGLEKELVERGVTRSVAADLVRDFPADRIRHQIAVVDWLRETKPKRVKDLRLPRRCHSEGLRVAGRFPEPGGAGRGGGGRGAAIEREEQARQAKARGRRSGTGSRRTGRTAPGAAGRLEAEALEQAAPAARAAYEAARRPSDGCSWSASATP